MRKAKRTSKEAPRGLGVGPRKFRPIPTLKQLNQVSFWWLGWEVGAHTFTPMQFKCTMKTQWVAIKSDTTPRYNCKYKKFVYKKPTKLASMV